MAKKNLLKFLMCDYQGYSTPKDFLVMVHGIFAGLGDEKSPRSGKRSSSKRKELI